MSWLHYRAALILASMYANKNTHAVGCFIESISSTVIGLAARRCKTAARRRRWMKVAVAFTRTHAILAGMMMGDDAPFQRRPDYHCGRVMLKIYLLHKSN